MMRHLLVLVIGLFCLTTAWAANDTSKQKLKAVDKKIQTLRHSLIQDKKQRRQFQDELQYLEVQLGKLNKATAQTAKNITKQREKLHALAKEKLVFQQQLVKQRALLAKQLGLAYRLGKYEYVKLLLNQENLTFLDRAFMYFGYFNHARLTIMQDLRQTVAKLDKNQADIQTHTKEMLALQKQQAQQQQHLANYKRERQQLIIKLTHQIQSTGHRIAGLMANKRALEMVIKRIPQTRLGKFRSVYRQRGHLPWPIEGKIVTHFGSAIEHSRLTYNGVLLQAEPGQAVRAVTDGNVVFANWLSGFGLLIIVQHPGQYMTLYGHNQSLYKRVGDRVAAGDLIATVGNSGGYRQSGLYFEIRHKGVPLNPERWCRKQGVLNYVSQ